HLPESATVLGINLTVCGQVDRHAFPRRMTLGLNRQVPDEFVTGFDAVFQKEAVAHDVVSHVVLVSQLVGAVVGHAAVEGLMDGRVPDVLPLSGFTDPM